MTDRFVETQYTRQARVACRILLDSNRIGLFDGPPGTGKTTTAEKFATQVHCPVAIITMPHHPAPLEVLRKVIEVLTGVPGTGSKSQMEDEAIGLLTNWHGLLIVDEVQNCGTAGIQTLRYLHDRSACSFAMLLVGWHALKTVQGHPDLESRVIAQVVFAPLTGDDLYAYLSQRYPELAGTPRPVLQYVNDKTARGNLREWRNFVESITAVNMQGRLRSAADVDAVLGVLKGAA